MLILFALGVADASSADSRPVDSGPDMRAITVTTIADAGPGSLRDALEQAAASGLPHRIGFGAAEGLFGTPQTIGLSAPMPVIQSEVVIDGYISGLLWKSYGVTVSGAGRHRVFEVAPGASLRVRGISIAHGRADSGAAILNRGRLIVEGVTLLSNQADGSGGAIANFGGSVFLINSTALDNRARTGGAVAGRDGELRIIHATLADNQAANGSAIHSSGRLLLGNSILSGDSELCVNTGMLLPESGHNLFDSGQGCGEPLLRADPRLGTLGYYNGPTPVLPIDGTSPALNLGAVELAVDDAGRPLVWDQRGNGDPRFAAGYADLGAFERQSLLPDELVVDILEDNGLRGCTVAAMGDCPLRAALELAAAGRRPVPVRFHPRVFAQRQELRLAAIPEGAGQALLIDGGGAAAITIIVPGPVPWRAINGVRIVAAGAGAFGRVDARQ